MLVITGFWLIISLISLVVGFRACQKEGAAEDLEKAGGGGIPSAVPAQVAPMPLVAPMQPQGQQMMVTAAGPAGTQMSLQTPTGIMTVAVPPGIASGQQFAVMMQMPAQPVMAQPVEMQPQMMVVKQPNTARQLS